MDPNQTPRHRDTKQPTLRSILRPPSGSRRSPSQENPSVQFQTPSSRPSPSKSSISMSQIPRDGPIPPVLLPATQNSQQLEDLILDLAAQLRAQRIGQPPQKLFTRPVGRMDAFPEFRDAMLDRWTAGPGYGPVLEPEAVTNLRLHPLIHPVFSPPSSNSDRLAWNMIFPPSTAVRTRNNVQEPFDSFCLEPATFPRVSVLHIASRRMPLVFIVRADEDSIGVTVGDVLKVLSRYLRVGLNEVDLQSTTAEHRKAIIATHEARIQILQPKHQTGIQIIDWMVGHTHFTGFIHDIEYLEGQFPDTSSNLHLVLCSESGML